MPLASTNVFANGLASGSASSFAYGTTRASARGSANGFTLSRALGIPIKYSAMIGKLYFNTALLKPCFSAVVFDLH